MKQKRQTKSKEYILEALTQLLAEQSWDQISISQICKKAGINRGTFYLHYTDKFDLMDKLKQEKITALLQVLDSKDLSNQDLIEHMLEVIQIDGSFLQVYLRQEGLTFQSGFFEILESVLNRIPSIDADLSTHYQIPLHYARGVYMASVREIISIWIKNDFPEDTETLATYILQVGQIREVNEK